MKKKMKAPSAVRSGRYEFVKLNTESYGWRDAYHYVLTLSWPRFAALLMGTYFLVNLLFASLYALGDADIAQMRLHSFNDAFFFSVETLATVGYGHMYPSSFYGHCVATMEIMTGMFGMAVVTGLIFVRFSRPRPGILFSNVAVIAPFRGVPTLMIRVANVRNHPMVDAQFRLIFLRLEDIGQGESMVRFYPLKLHFDHLTNFPASLTLLHTIDENSPLWGSTGADLEETAARIMAQTCCIDSVISGPIQSLNDYLPHDILWNRRFVELYTEIGRGRFSVDFSKFHETEPVRTEAPNDS